MAEILTKPEDEPYDPDLERKLKMLDKDRAWRAEQLLNMGFTLEQTLVLSKIADITHAAKPLIDGGCDVDTAFDILT